MIKDTNMDAAKMVPVLFNLRTGAQTFFRRGGSHCAKRSVVTIPDWIKNATGNRFGNVVFPLRRQVCRSIRKLRTGPLVPYIFRHVRTEYGTADLSRDVKLLLFGVYAVLSLPTTVLAQSYPTRAITLVVPYAAGTGVDGLGRALASHLGKGLGQPVVVENRPGAGTNIGTGYVARSKPDGYTLVLAANSGLAANKSLYSQLGYDPQADLAPVAFLGKGAMVILATPASNVRTMAQLVEHAKTDPSKINFGAANTTARVWIELIKSAAGIQGQTILYTNAGVMLNDMLGGQISFSVENTGTSRALVSSGKRWYAGTTRRLSSFRN